MQQIHRWLPEVIMSNSTTDNIKGYCNATDGEGDDLAYQYQWYNGSTVYFNGTLFKEGSISAGYYHTCGIRANDSRVLCWGGGDYGQLGDGNNATHNTLNPNITTDSSAYSSISAGGYHTCGIRSSDSRVLCWGRGNEGQLGDSSTAVHEVGNPNVTVDNSSYSSISTGRTHTCGIRTNDSRVLCWGDDTYGQIGNGDTSENLVPTNTTDSSAYTSISAGWRQTCGIRTNDSRVICWGHGTSGQLGDGQTIVSKPNPNVTTDSSAYISINTGEYHTCGIRANDSRVMCWGRGLEGELGDGQTAVNKPNPNITTDASAYGRGFSSSEEILVSILGSAFLNIGETWSLGCRAYDFTGYSSWMNSSGITIIETNPPAVTINTPLNTTYGSTVVFNVTATDSSGISACVYSLDNALNVSMTNITVSEWNATNSSMTEGSHNVKFYCNDTLGNINGSLNRTFSINYIPLMISSKINSTTNSSTENIKGYCNATDGDGDDLAYQYQWYNGSKVYFNGTLFKEGSISTGRYHSCGIRANDSRILCWGNGDFGQLGDGSNVTHNVGNPNVTTDVSAYMSISAGDYHTCGIRANDSRVLCWGDSEYGQLGDGQITTDRTSPYITTDTSAYSSISAGDYHTCGIRANDSRVLCWGAGDYGQLGDGSNATHNTLNPNLTTDSSAYTKVIAGGYHTCGIRTNDSRVMCWG